MLIRPPLKKKKKSPIFLKRRRKKQKTKNKKHLVIWEQYGCGAFPCCSLPSQLRENYSAGGFNSLFSFFYGFLIDNLIAKVTHTYLQHQISSFNFIFLRGGEGVYNQTTTTKSIVILQLVVVCTANTSPSQNKRIYSTFQTFF